MKSAFQENLQTFQSTRPVWGATRSGAQWIRDGRYFNPRAPCGARLFFRDFHDLRYGFQSTRPVWGATTPPREYLNLGLISIHAPRVGRDGTAGNANTVGDISIHAPRVGRDGALSQDLPGDPISIHAPRVGRDCPIRTQNEEDANFNPRAPCGARRKSTWSRKSGIEFQSTRPVWGATSVALERMSLA